MKCTLFSIFICLFATSCKLGELPYTHTETEPYVKTWNGERYVGKNVERIHNPFQQDVIQVDDMTIKSRDVAFYATGHDNYANIGNKAFAVQVAAGPINLYHYHDHSFIPSIRRRKLAGRGQKTWFAKDYFIQKLKDEPLQYLNYENICPMLTQGTPEAEVLERYRKNRAMTRAIDYTEGAMAATGISLVVSAAINTNNNLNLLSPGFFLILWSGILCDCIDYPAHFYSEKKLFQVVLLADRPK